MTTIPMVDFAYKKKVLKFKILVFLKHINE